MQVPKQKKEKVRRKKSKITRKTAKEGKNYTQALREERCENSNTRGVLNFRTKG